MTNVLQGVDMQQTITNIYNNLWELHTRIGQREQTNKQQLKSVRTGYTNLKDILGARFLAAEHSLD